MASCYTATYALVASQMGIRLRRLAVRLEMSMDYSLVYGLFLEPPMEVVKLTLIVQADVPEDRLREVEELAQQRCPAVFCLTHPIRLEPALEVLA